MWKLFILPDLIRWLYFCKVNQLNTVDMHYSLCMDDGPLYIMKIIFILTFHIVWIGMMASYMMYHASEVLSVVVMIVIVQCVMPQLFSR